MIGIVWCHIRSNGIKEFNKIIADYMRAEIQISKQGIDKVVFDNGDTWFLIQINNINFHGLRCNISYIDCQISDHIIDIIIVPCTNRLPYNAIHYY